MTSFLLASILAWFALVLLFGVVYWLMGPMWTILAFIAVGALLFRENRDMGNWL